MPFRYGGYCTLEEREYVHLGEKLQKIAGAFR